MTTSTRRTLIALGALATAATALSAPAGATTRTLTAQEGDESDWWWLLVPFVLILVGLALIWMFRKARGGSSVVERSTRPVTREGSASAVAAEPSVPVVSEAAGPSAGVDVPTAVAAEEPSPASLEGLDAPAGSPAAAGAAAVASPTSAEQTSTSPSEPAGRSETGEMSPALPPIPDFADDVMTGPDLSVPADHHGHGDGVGSYRRGGESVPVPIGAHLPVVGSGEPPEGYSIKADAESGTYHTPDQSTYDELSPDIWFASESAAESAHFHKAGREPDLA